SLLWSLEETQRLASMVARRNSASRFYGRSTGFETGSRFTKETAIIGRRQFHLLNLIHFHPFLF
ncbi:hypothetical protein, partial [Leptospira borgpetersenii]|uniref:hypothetical protein n=1 Tax=Leptospira borgpetersenii TaxID=174 RepID=UPI003B984B27